MKFLLVLTLFFISSNLTCGQIEQTILCNEKFKKNTERDYTGYSGCLIEKRRPPKSDRSKLPWTYNRCSAKQVKFVEEKKVVEYIQLNYTIELAEGDHEQFKGLKIDFDGTSDHMSPTYYFEFPEYYDKNKKTSFIFIVNPFGDPLYEGTQKLEEYDEEYFIDFQAVPQRGMHCEIEFATKIIPIGVKPTAPPTKQAESQYSVLLIVLYAFCALITVLVLGFLYFYFKMPTDPENDRLVVLVSSGDQTTEHVKRAGELAGNLKSSGRFARVFFSGWLKRGQAGGNTAELDDAISGGTRFVLYASPFGKKSYEESVARGSQATWKDEFVVGARSLLGKEGKPLKGRKLFVVFDSGAAGREEVLCGDFRKRRCYDLSKEFDRKVFFTKLIGFRYSRRKEEKESLEAKEMLL